MLRRSPGVSPKKTAASPPATSRDTVPVQGVFPLVIGALLRHTAGAIGTAIGVVFVLPTVAGLLPGSSGQHATTTCRPWPGP
jgi:hypothetical protein